jgi:hypothetical protein
VSSRATRWLAPGALASVMLLAACASSPVKGVARAAVPAAPKEAAACRFQVADVQDLREDKALGRMGPRHVDAQDFPDWFKDGLARMPGYSTDPVAVQLHVQVLKAYIQGMSSLKSANLVVRVRIDGPGHAPAWHNLRGVDDSMNWVNGESEMQEAFDRALAGLTTQLQADLATACAGH